MMSIMKNKAASFSAAEYSPLFANSMSEQQQQQQRLKPRFYTTKVLFAGMVTLFLVVLLSIENMHSLRDSSGGSTTLQKRGSTTMVVREVKSLFHEHMNMAMSRDYYYFNRRPAYNSNTVDRTATITSSNNNNGMAAPKFVLGIFSMDNDEKAERRKLIRDTYLTVNRPDNLGDPRVCSLLAYLEHNSGSNKSNDMDECVVLYVFVVGGIPESFHDGNIPADHFETDRSILLSRKKQLHNPSTETDVIYLNIKENMNAGKTPTFFKWVASLPQKGNIDYVAKCDDDTMIYMPSFFRHVVYKLPPAPYNDRMYGGKRTDWYQCGQHEHCGSIIPHGYMTGMFFFMSVDLARDVTSDDNGRKYDIVNPKGKHFEDMDMGRWVFQNVQKTRTPVTLVHSGLRVFYWIHPVKDGDEWKRLWDGYEHGSVPYICSEGYGDPKNPGCKE